jgi:hypothetical protein
MDIWECFARHEAELAQQSVAWDDQTDPYSAEAGAKDARGMVYGRIALTERSFLSVHELIEVVGDDATRRKYAYYLLYDGEPLWGEEFDPEQATDPHRYDRAHNRAPSSMISLADAVAEASTIAREEASRQGATPSQ